MATNINAEQYAERLENTEKPFVLEFGADW